MNIRRYNAYVPAKLVRNIKRIRKSETDRSSFLCMRSHSLSIYALLLSGYNMLEEDYRAGLIPNPVYYRNLERIMDLYGSLLHHYKNSLSYLMQEDGDADLKASDYEDCYGVAIETYSLLEESYKSIKKRFCITTVLLRHCNTVNTAGKDFAT